MMLRGRSSGKGSRPAGTGLMPGTAVAIGMILLAGGSWGVGIRRREGSGTDTPAPPEVNTDPLRSQSVPPQVGGTHPITVTLVLAGHPERMETLKQLHHNVSLPGHAQRGRYLHPHEAVKLLSPSDATLTAVARFLSTTRFGETVARSLKASPSADILRFTSTVSAVETHLGLRCACGAHQLGQPTRSRHRRSAAATAHHVRCVPTAHPIGGSTALGAHLDHAEATAVALGGSCSAAAVAHPAVGRSASEHAASAVHAERRALSPIEHAAAVLPDACLQTLINPVDAPCGPDPAHHTPTIYSRAQLPPAPIAVDWIGIVPTVNTTLSTVTSIILWPYCWGSLWPLVTPISTTDIDDTTARMLWADKLVDPCGLGTAAGRPSSYTICLEATNPSSASSTAEVSDCFTVSADDSTITCATIDEELCLAGTDRANLSAYSSRTYKHSYCVIAAVPGQRAQLGVNYQVTTTMTLADGSNHTAFAATTVPGQDGEASQQRTTLFRTELKMPSAMRAWMNMSSTDIASVTTRPNAFGILQYPSVSGGSYSIDDLRTYLTIGQVPHAEQLISNVEFLGMPSIPAARSAAMQKALASINASSITTAHTPCRVANDPAMCDCGTKPAYGGESTLDVQQIIAAAQGGSVYAFRSGYWTRNWVAASDYIDTLYALLDVSWAALYGNVQPQTLSFSYGMPMGACSANIVQRPFGDVNAERVMVERADAYFMALGIIGTSVFASSGDKGAHAGCEFAILNGDGGCGEWITSYPAVSAYVTAVGGSEFVPAEAVSFGDPDCRTFGGASTRVQNTTCVQEAAISIGIAGSITSGGGFANTSIEGYSALPQWQADAVQTYLDTGSYGTSTGRAATPSASTLGRGYPDISGFAGNIGIVIDGITGGSGGTSASSPFLAGVIGVLNTQLVASGKTYVGFLNPTLYAAHAATNGAAFNDITTGDINCRGQNSPGTAICCSTGYSAVEGWDPATGLGSLNFGVFRDYVLTTMPDNATAHWSKSMPSVGGDMCATPAMPYLGKECTKSDDALFSTTTAIVVVSMVLVAAALVVGMRCFGHRSGGRGGDLSKGPYLTVAHAQHILGDADSSDEDGNVYSDLSLTEMPQSPLSGFE